jgi:hypothetical protein
MSEVPEDSRKFAKRPGSQSFRGTTLSPRRYRIVTAFPVNK